MKETPFTSYSLFLRFKESYFGLLGVFFSQSYAAIGNHSLNSRRPEMNVKKFPHQCQFRRGDFSNGLNKNRKPLRVHVCTGNLICATRMECAQRQARLQAARRRTTIEFHSWVVVSHLSGFILSFLCIWTSRSA